ncbi:hypothetical protein RD792_000615 [Penstemon davidsonii]|uniref:Phytocyanin domain-containing protein n=1 Tax=Penstemon davidsonii TaxID=160366 RepID=A0ABR0DL62_9LAMI|nr:hypothetical protein RD792_000615 [Penstemon davidsonii]
MANFTSESACLMVVLLIFGAIRAVPAAVYTVGDSSGWSMAGDYGTWATDKSFAVGDTLVFNYSPGHTVDEVSESDYKLCTSGNSIATDSSGATSITLKTAGSHYFICGTPGHCSGGMKISVNVAPSATGGATTPSISPSSTTTTTPTPSLASPAGGAANTPSTGGNTHVTQSSSNSSAALSPAVAMLFTFCINVMFKSFF